MRQPKITKSLTFEEIGGILDISPQQVHKIEREAFNKLFSGLLTSNQFNPVELVSGVCNFFGMQLEQFMKKLDKKNKENLLKFISGEYEKYIPGISEMLKEAEFGTLEELIR